MSGSASPSPDELRAFALGLLARREYGAEELAAKLARQWPSALAPDAGIADCLAQLTAEGLLSEERFAEAFVRSRRGRGQGPMKIRAELQRRCSDAGQISRHLADDDDAWIRDALDWLERQRADVADRAAQARWYRRLLSRGFSHAQARSALDQLGRHRAIPPRDS